MTGGRATAMREYSMSEYVQVDLISAPPKWVRVGHQREKIKRRRKRQYHLDDLSHWDSVD